MPSRWWRFVLRLRMAAWLCFSSAERLRDSAAAALLSASVVAAASAARASAAAALASTLACTSLSFAPPFLSEDFFVVLPQRLAACGDGTEGTHDGRRVHRTMRPMLLWHAWA